MEKILDSFVIIDNKTVEHPRNEHRKIIIFKNEKNDKFKRCEYASRKSMG